MCTSYADTTMCLRDRMRAWKYAWVRSPYAHGAEILLSEKFYLNSQDIVKLNNLVRKAKRKKIEISQCLRKMAYLRRRLDEAFHISLYTISTKCMFASNDITSILTKLSKNINRVVAFRGEINYCFNGIYNTGPFNETSYCRKVSWANCMETVEPRPSGLLGHKTICSLFHL